MAMSGDDEDDPVVAEVDMYLSQQLAKQLYLIQYPVRPSHMPYDDAVCLAARIKPSQQRLELEFPLNTQSANYANSKGEQIALNVDGSVSSHFGSDKMDKQVISSIPAGLSTSRYVVGYFKDSELHVTPLKGIVQMRPSFNYLDKADAREKKMAETTGGGGDSQDEEEEAKAVTVKYARRETEEAKARRMASYEYVNKRREEEHWIHLRHHQIYDAAAERERARLCCPHNQESSEFHMPSQSYLHKLIPEELEEENKKPPLPSNVLSLAELKTMNLGDQIRSLLRNAKVLRFSQLMTLLPKGTEVVAALRALQQVAVMVQGTWVVKSEVLYPKDTFSAHSGTPSETLCRGRDYVMWRFTQSRFVVRKDIASVIKLHAEDVKEILEQMSRLKVSKGWEFVLPYDAEFVNRHQDVTQRQQMLWDAKFQQLSKVLKISKADLDRKAKSDEQHVSSPEKPKRRRTSSTRSRTKSGGMSDQSDNDDVRGDRSRQNSGQVNSYKNSGHVDSREAAFNHDVTDSEDTAGSEDIVNGDTPPAELKKELLEFVRDKLSSRYVVTLSDIKHMFALKLTQCPAGHILGTGVSEKMLERTLMESGATAVPNCDELTYALSQVGDPLDPIREELLTVLATNKCFKSTILKKRLEDRFGEAPNENDMKKILRDYCLTKGSLWHLKTMKFDS